MKYIPPSNQTSWSISLLRKKKEVKGGLAATATEADSLKNSNVIEKWAKHDGKKKVRVKLKGGGGIHKAEPEKSELKLHKMKSSRYAAHLLCPLSNSPPLHSNAHLFLTRQRRRSFSETPPAALRPCCLPSPSSWLLLLLLANIWTSSARQGESVCVCVWVCAGLSLSVCVCVCVCLCELSFLGECKGESLRGSTLVTCAETRFLFHHFFLYFSLRLKTPYPPPPLAFPRQFRFRFYCAKFFFQGKPPPACVSVCVCKDRCRCSCVLYFIFSIFDVDVAAVAVAS